MKTRVENDTVVINELIIPRALYDALVVVSSGIGVQKAIERAIEDSPAIENREHPKVRERFLRAAMKKYEHDHLVEIDPGAARVAYSGARGGAHVQGWLWVDDNEAEVAPGERPDET
jgi:hypothetical protein